jgi:hypothetical protein
MTMKAVLLGSIPALLASLVLGAASTPAQADFKVGLNSLEGDFIGNETDQAYINALAANPVTVTVVDFEGAQPPVVTQFNAQQVKKEITVPTGAASTIRVTFSCPGLTTARLDPVVNVANAKFQVAMPKETSVTPPNCQCYPCCVPVAHRRGLFRR